jgi:hypothetical protein
MVKKASAIGQVSGITCQKRKLGPVLF